MTNSGVRTDSARSCGTLPDPKCRNDCRHIEDFAHVFGVYPEAKYRRASYGSFARVLWLEAGEGAVVEYTRRLVFNVLIGNADAHLKNWSLIFSDGRMPRLAPAYDLVGTVPSLPTTDWRSRSVIRRSSPRSTSMSVPSLSRKSRPASPPGVADGPRDRSEGVGSLAGPRAAAGASGSHSNGDWRAQCERCHCSHPVLRRGKAHAQSNPQVT